jgi:ferredoxin
MGAEMNLASVRLIYFSPTHTTRRILEGIAHGMPGVPIDHLDLTPPVTRTQELATLPEALAIIGAPVYSGRIPIEAVHRLRRLKGNGALAVPVVVYGNRAYEDALLELRDLAQELGFTPVAAAAFVGEHSFSNGATPIAHGRPDPDDLQHAAEFGKRVREKLETLSTCECLPLLCVPGNAPYKERRAPSQIPPVRQEALCVKCGKCVTVCPTAAITMGDTVFTDPSVCIICCACIKRCPTGARTIEDPRIRQTAERLSLNCRIRQQPEMFT